MDFTGDDYIRPSSKYPGSLGIETLDGVLLVTLGDYVIKGISGEFYPCKPDIFIKTYEEVEEKKDEN